MHLKRSPWVLVPVISLVSVWYFVEPWFVTFIDDGPYYSTPYSHPIDDLPVYSQLELRRFAIPLYRLESRLLDGQSESVLVLRHAAGPVIWARLPLKPDGELGPVEVRRHYWTWYGGWRVAIKPANQESGNLYLGTFGRFRFFNHSW